MPKSVDGHGCRRKNRQLIKLTQYRILRQLMHQTQIGPQMWCCTQARLNSPPPPKKSPPSPHERLAPSTLASAFDACLGQILFKFTALSGGANMTLHNKHHSSTIGVRGVIKKRSKLYKNNYVWNNCIYMSS